MKNMVRRSAAGVAVGLLALGLAACGDTKNTDTSGDSTAAAAGQCGTIPQQLAKDPDGVLAALGADYLKAYNGYNGTVYKSAWSDWQPAKSSGLTVGVVLSQFSNPWQKGVYDALTAGLAKLPQVGKVVPLVSSDNVTDQLQQFRSLVAQKVDFIIYQPLSPDAFVAAADDAAKAGIPTLSIVNSTPTKNTINLVPNPFLQGANQAATVAKNAGGKGTVLGVHGIPGVGIDTDTFAGIKAALALCPDMTLDDSVTGQFQDAVAKTEVLKYLTSHPGKIAGAVEPGPMTMGIISAFEQAGREVPTVGDAGAQKAALAYWRDHSEYKGVSIAMGAAAFGDAAVRLTGKILNGDGIKVSDVVIEQPVITSETLSQWVDASWTTTTPGSAEGPAGVFAPDAYLAKLFTK